MLLVNDRRVLLHRVNSHDHHETHGKALERETLRQDAVLVNRFNLNVVLCARYPNDPHWLDLCNELGRYLICRIARILLPEQSAPAATPAPFSTAHALSLSLFYPSIHFREDLLRKIISNPLYRGVVRFNGTEYKGQHVPLVPEDAWEAANAAISQAKATPEPTAALLLDRDKHFNLLKGLLYCGCCKGAFVPHASGKLDSQGKPYRYYTCNQVIHNRSVARCLVRQISAVAVEEAVVGLLGQMARHPTLIETVLDFGKANAGGAQKELELRIHKLDREIEKITASLGNLLNALAEHGVSSLREEIRAKFEELKRRKEQALVERTRARQDLEALTHDALAPAQICASLEKFEKLWPDFTQEEKREFVSLIVARVTVHSDEGKTEGRENARLVELRVKLHLPELLGGGADAESTARRLGGRRPSFTLNATVALAVGTGDTVILAPFHHRVTARAQTTDKKKNPRAKTRPSLHPIHRAMAWQQKIALRPELSARKLAEEEGVILTTVTRHLSLLRLTPHIQEFLRQLHDPKAVHFFSLRKLGPLSTLSHERQLEVFALLQKRFPL